MFRLRIRREHYFVLHTVFSGDNLLFNVCAELALFPKMFSVYFFKILVCKVFFAFAF